MLGVVPENVRVKRSKMMRGLSVKKRRSFMKAKAREQFF
jgi:threonylcarbamoyladenosine tRNA methylthiotransferase MtaB